MALRYDTGTLRPPVRMPDGRLRADGCLTRTGVFSYRNPDGTVRREYRPPDEVFHADSLASFAMVPVTDDHPPDMLTSTTARKFAVGTVGEGVRKDGDHVAAPLMVFDEDTIKKMDAGKVELSCGYEADIDPTPGVSPEGERYDVIQRKIRGNHVAIVDVGRAGHSARVRMDAAMMVSEQPQPESRTDIMDELKKALEAAAAEKVRADNAIAEAAAIKVRADKAEGERDALKAQLESAEKARKDAVDSINENVRARVTLETKASPILGAEVKLDGLTEREIKLAVVKKIDGIDVPSEKSDSYIDARYDSAIERAARADDALGAVRGAADAGRNDAGDAEAVAAKKMRERSANAYKKES